MNNKLNKSQKRKCHNFKNKPKKLKKDLEDYLENQYLESDTNVYLKCLEDEKEEESQKKNYLGDFDEDEESDSDIDSDTELQNALLDGSLKPGLHAEVPLLKKKIINNINQIESKLNDFKLNLDWIEKLDSVSNENDIINFNNKDANKNEENIEINLNNDLDIVRNDIKRELKFMQQAKINSIKCLEKLKKLKIPTVKPDDYFAEMLKSEEHMTIVKKTKEKIELIKEKKSKIKTLREQKKMGKKIQQEVLKERQKEKKEFQDKLKKIKKGDINSSKFLEESFKNKKAANKSKKLSKKEYKNSKYGYGGIKRDRKKNTAESSALFKGFKPIKKGSKKKGFK